MKVIAGRIPKINFDKIVEGLEDDDEDLQLWKELARLSKKDKLTEEDVRNAMQATCYGSLAFCCGFESGCIYREAVRSVLKISDDAYLRLKADSTRKFIRAAVTVDDNY